MYPLNILIAEPDMMLRTLYRKTVSEVPGYVFAGYADNGDALHSIVACTAVNVVLLDILLPRFGSLEGFRAMRAEFPRTDFIILSSEKTPDVVRGTICSGAFDYLIKPFEWERFERALAAYSEYHRSLVDRKRPWRQEDIDRLPGFRKQLPENSQPTPKGFQETLLNRLFNLLRESSSPLSASEAGRILGISRSSARRYLEYLADEGEIAVQYEFTQVGRPRKLYSVHFRAKEGSV
ncbi:MAG: response regulator [Synergistaceae bacterium]|nr:response regulator [Synergistaceae bacterium]